MSECEKVFFSPNQAVTKIAFAVHFILHKNKQNFIFYRLFYLIKVRFVGNMVFKIQSFFGTFGTMFIICFNLPRKILQKPLPNARIFQKCNIFKCIFSAT
jgi:hypothetical protein